MTSFIDQFIHNFIFIFGETGLGFALFIWALRLINHNSKQLLANQAGISWQLIIGGLGIIIHETSHLLMALLFAHHIDRFRLIKLPHPPTDNTLGYVNHSFNPHSIYQNIGNLFIGIAPILGCSFVIVMLTNMLTPGLISYLVGMVNQIPENKMPPINWWHAVWLILLVTNISVGGFDLSREDLQNARAGLMTTLFLMIIVVVGVSIFNPGNSLSIILNYLVTTLGGILSFSLIVSLVINIGLKIIFAC